MNFAFFDDQADIDEKQYRQSKTTELEDWVRTRAIADWPHLSLDSPNKNLLTSDNVVLCSRNIITPESLRTKLDRSPCCLCRPYNPHFFHGYLLYFRSENKFRVIGVDCGKKYFGSNEWTSIIKSHENELFYEKIFELINSDQFKKYYEKLKIIKLRASEIFESQMRLRRFIGNDISTSLFKNLIQNNCFAKIFREKKTVDGKKILEEVFSLSISGVMFLDGKPKNFYMRALREYEFIHKYIDLDHDSQFKSLDDLFNNHRLEAEFKNLNGAISFIDSVIDNWREFYFFRSNENLSNLIKWSAQPDCPISIDIRRDQYGRLKKKSQICISIFDRDVEKDIITLIK